MVRTRSNHARAGLVHPEGFTLVEILLVVALVALFAGIALPLYEKSVTKARRSDAKVALLTVANRQESYMLDRSSYTDNMVDLGFGVDPMVSEEGYYEIDAAACASGTIASCYVLTATPRQSSAQAGDSECTRFRLDSTGDRSASGSLAAECW